MNLPQIEFVYFDLGKVILDFSHEMETENLHRQTGIPIHSIDEALFTSGLQDEFETGLLNKTQFTKKLNDRLGTDISVQDACFAVSNIFWLNRTTVPLIAQLAMANFPIGILSNTCAAHWEFIIERFPLIQRYFLAKHCVLSYQCNSMKPDKTIYETAIQTAGIDAAKIFFMDDRVENVGGAIAAGMQAELFVDTHQILKCPAMQSLRLNI